MFTQKWLGLGHEYSFIITAANDTDVEEYTEKRTVNRRNFPNMNIWTILHASKSRHHIQWWKDKWRIHFDDDFTVRPHSINYSTTNLSFESEQSKGFFPTELKFLYHCWCTSDTRCLTYISKRSSFDSRESRQSFEIYWKTTMYFL